MPVAISKQCFECDLHTFNLSAVLFDVGVHLRVRLLQLGNLNGGHIDSMCYLEEKVDYK